ncbi:MAG TPA: magnesium transporter CorA family protein [Baekduia sp.]|nr:magnesium transporter CorA family protein [Baekduia sp.]
MKFLDSIDEATIAACLEQKHFFWLDLFDPSSEELDAAQRIFGLHELATEDSREFGQRPKLERYEDHALIVFYGVHRGELVEIHVHVSGDWVLTVHRDGCAALKTAYKRMSVAGTRTEEEAVYRILDSLTDSFFPLLDDLDNRLDDLIDEIVEKPTDEHRHELFNQRRQLVEMRRVIAPQRDALLTGAVDLERIPGLDLDDTRDYFRDVVDHLTRLNELLDGMRDLISGALDVYLSTVSNRLNQVMKQLTLVSVIFLPLTFITGFFGQNFGWMVRHVNGFGEFIAFGGGAVLLAAISMFIWFRRSGFLN